MINKIKRFLARCLEQQQDMGLSAKGKVDPEFDRQIVVDKYLKEIENVRKSLCEDF